MNRTLSSPLTFLYKFLVSPLFAGVVLCCAFTCVQLSDNLVALPAALLGGVLFLGGFIHFRFPQEGRPSRRVVGGVEFRDVPNVSALDDYVSGRKCLIASPSGLGTVSVGRRQDKDDRVYAASAVHVLPSPSGCPRSEKPRCRELATGRTLRRGMPEGLGEPFKETTVGGCCNSCTVASHWPMKVAP